MPQIEVDFENKEAQKLQGLANSSQGCAILNEIRRFAWSRSEEFLKRLKKARTTL